MLENAATETTTRTAGQPDVQRTRLLGDLREAVSLPGIATEALDALRDKLAGSVFNLVVVGEFKRGKSSVVNALLGAQVLPTGVVPLTSVVTVLRHGESPAANVTFENGDQQAAGLDTLPEYVTERGNPRNEKHVREVEVTFPAPWLGQGIRLVDTPGIGSAYRHNTDVTYGYLPQADAVIFVASVDQPVSRSELEFLTDIRAYADRIFCLLNKIDHLSDTELAESVAFSSTALREALGMEVPIFPVSARAAIEARHEGVANGFARSGFAAFDVALRRFLQRDSGEALLRSVRRHLSRLLAGCHLAAELELQALAAPLEELGHNLRAFDAKKAEILQQRSDFDTLLQADARALFKQKVEPDIANFKRTLAQRLDAEVPAWMSEADDRSGRSQEAVLEQRIVSEIRRAFDIFRECEESTTRAEFDRVCDRFRQRIQQSVDALMQYSAGLFAIRFEAVPTEPRRGAQSRFYYKFWQEPSSLILLGGALAAWLPGPSRRPLLLRRARRLVADLVEMQSGRVRHDFEQRMTHAVADARKEMFEHSDATIKGIAAAIASGRALKSSGETNVTVRRREITAALEKIDELETRSDPIT